MPESKRTSSGFLITAVGIVMFYGIDRSINIYQNHQRLVILANDRLVSAADRQRLHDENEISKRERAELFRRIRFLEKSTGNAID